MLSRMAMAGEESLQLINTLSHSPNDGQAFTLHYITLSAFQTPPTPKLTSGASTITLP